MLRWVGWINEISDFQPENIAAPVLQDISLLDTSPSSVLASNVALNPGEIIRTSGKFVKPTKIPGKNYSKDEVVIRNADSGKGKNQSHIYFSLGQFVDCTTV